MHLVIYFCGTGNEGEGFEKDYLDNLPNSEVKTIFVNGCDHPEVCDSFIFPNLKEYASRFAKKLFQTNDTTHPEKNTPDKELRLTTTELANLKLGIKLKDASTNQTKTTIISSDKDKTIESITLCGYSRGAATCFEVAKQLNSIAHNIPVNIIADQPVTGNVYHGPGSNAHSIADCRNLKNLKNVDIILGSYTGDMTGHGMVTEEGIIITKESLSLWGKILFKALEWRHKLFYSQIIPKLPHTAKRNLTVIPVESHLSKHVNSPYDSGVHLNMYLTKHLFEQGKASGKVFVTETQLTKREKRVKESYSKNATYPAAPFPPVAELQGIFGTSKSNLYKHKDKFHPNSVSKGFEWNPTSLPPESLTQWWNRLDKKHASLSRSSDLTRQLVQTINDVKDVNDVSNLTKVFKQADLWLIKKATETSPRYELVEALRNHVYHHLVTTCGQDKTKLAAINRANLIDTKYFSTYWFKKSEALSRFKTAATRQLDLAFAHYDIDVKSDKLTADKMLMNSLKNWLEEKQESNSKRYDLAVEIYEHLQTIVNALEKEPAPMPLLK